MHRVLYELIEKEDYFSKVLVAKARQIANILNDVSLHDARRLLDLIREIYSPQFPRSGKAISKKTAEIFQIIYSQNN